MGFLMMGKGDSRRASREQAKAIKDSANAATLSANYQAEATAQQMSLAQEQRSQQQYANDLLSTPMDSATVDLAESEDEDDDGDDLLGRRRSTRESYQNQKPRTAGLNIP